MMNQPLNARALATAVATNLNSDAIIENHIRWLNDAAHNFACAAMAAHAAGDMEAGKVAAREMRRLYAAAGLATERRIGR